MSHSSTSLEEFHRRLCFVTDRLVLSGDLPESPDHALIHLRSWVAAGVTHIVDCRREWSDEEFVRTHAPLTQYVWLGTEDDGATQSPDWFERGVSRVISALDDPSARVLVHCHMGINRAPSMMFAILLASGRHPLAALEAIRAARPIAALLYAQDALAWWHARTSVRASVRFEQRSAVAEWMNAHQIDVATTIRRIRAAEHDPLECISPTGGGSVRPIRFEDLVEIIGEEAELPNAPALEVLEVLETQVADAFEAGNPILLPLVGLLELASAAPNGSPKAALTLGDFAVSVARTCGLDTAAVDAAIEAIVDLLDGRDVLYTNLDGWYRLDAHEQSLGVPHGRARIKVVPRDEMVRISRD